MNVNSAHVEPWPGTNRNGYISGGTVVESAAALLSFPIPAREVRSMIDLDAVSQASLMTFNRTIARWTRLSGSADERAAADYVEGQLKGFGYATRIVMHDAYISLPGAATLRLTRPKAREIACIT